MINNDILLNYLDRMLDPQSFNDYCPNGLQIEGKQEIKKIVTAVTASKNIIEKAIEADADALLVHHGYFWKGETSSIQGYKRDRIKLLLENDINLYAYHLPLDCHNTFGNNVQLARILGLHVTGPLTLTERGIALGNVGNFNKKISATEMSELIAAKLGQEPIHVCADKFGIKTVAWCTGAAQDYIEDAAKHNVDAFISGEISERTYHLAKELGVDYFACGHHATERYGVKALGEHLAEHFKIPVDFIDEGNPV